jgi:hypothetical protein
MAIDHKNDQERADFLLVSTGIPLSSAEKKTISDALQKTFMTELAKIDHSSGLVSSELADLPRARGGVNIKDDFLTLGQGTAGVYIRTK